MEKIGELSNSFESTLKDSDLRNLAEEIGEFGIDSLLDDGMLKDVPIIGFISGLTKTAVNIQDRLFLKKIIHFLTELNDTDPQKRNKLISEINDSEKFEIKVGEKLLYIIDKCEDHVSALYVAELFSAFLNEEIDYSDFLRGATIIQNIFAEDFKYFLNTEVPKIEREISPQDEIPDIINNLVNSGLCAMITDKVRVEDQDDPDFRHEKYVVSGGNTYFYITEIGNKIKDVLN